MPGATLPEDFLAATDAALSETDTFLQRAYPGEDGRRQPVHTVYVPADRYTPGLPRQWGQAALALIDEHGGMTALCGQLGLDPDLSAQVAERVTAKLASDPIEDLRLDFEDGYGDRGQQSEDADSVRAAASLAEAVGAGTAPEFFGIRFKCFEAATRRRGIRTVDLFLAALLERLGELPAGLVLTLPKVSTVSQVEAMVAVCGALETAHQLPPGRLRFEVQVETPQLILGADGRAPVAAAIHAGDGRVTSLHYGTYDYSASLQIAAEHQAADHPAADHAKQVMQLAAAGTGVHVADGSTNVLPVGAPDHVRSAWRLHFGLVRRALQRGFYQGWDLHAGQLPTRYLATFAFYREGFPRAARRLADYVANTGSGVLDEPATVRALARYLRRGYACGAVEESELVAGAHLDAGQLAALARPHSDTETLRAGPDARLIRRDATPVPRSAPVTSAYYAPHGGHPDQTELLTDRAMFGESYAVLPRGTMRDIVTSLLPFWDRTRLWVIARPLSGFAETFSQYIVEVAPGGGSDKPELDPQAEGVLFVVEGALQLTVGSEEHTLEAGGYAYLPPGSDWTLHNRGGEPARFHWIRKAYEAVDGLAAPPAFVTSDAEVEPIPMPGTDGRWATSHFADPADVRHDMHVNIVTFQPGASIPFAETHVMEHGLYVLQGKAVYRLNQDWVEVQEGDFMWLRAFCPQACYAGGPGPFRYLLYKDVNRHARLSRQFL